MNIIIEAARLANEAHKGQVRKWGNNEPYITHPLRVMNMVLLCPFATETMIAASVLHDVLEDTKLTEADLVANGFDNEVVWFVLQLTNASKLDPLLTCKPRAERKAADRAKLANVSWEAKLIKLADRIDNLSDMNHSATPADFAVMYKNESKQLLEVLKGTDAELEAQLEKLIG